jgi:hypothetical protein
MFKAFKLCFHNTPYDPSTMALSILGTSFFDLGLSIHTEHPTMNVTLDFFIGSISITKSVCMLFTTVTAWHTKTISTGEMEGTLLRGAVRNANLFALLSDDDNLRNMVTDLVETMDVIEKEDVRGFRLAAMVNPMVPGFTANAKLTPGSLDGPHFQLLSTLRQADGYTHFLNKVLFLEEISHNGVCYGTYPSSHYKNSAIIFRQPNSDIKAGVIQNIFEHSCSVEEKDYFLTLHIYTPINRANFSDPYRPFGFAAGYLCDSQPIGTVVIKLCQVVSHFVLTPIEEIDAIHILPVDRVSARPSFFLTQVLNVFGFLVSSC